MAGEMMIKLMLGDCLQKLTEIPDNSVDSIVTDPPYGLCFMGKSWDYDVPAQHIWEECLRVLKPGGHLLAFFGTRTYHRGVIKIEDAGFEIRDQIQWIYGSGFPKSTNVALRIDKELGAIGNRGKGFNTAGQGISLNQNKELRSDHPDYKPPEYKTSEAIQWQGWGTALKPANEPIVVARKPLEKGLTVAENVLKWGTGALNIDGSRIAVDANDPNIRTGNTKSNGLNSILNIGDVTTPRGPAELGRWPANVLFDEEAASVLDEQSKDGRAGKPSGTFSRRVKRGILPTQNHGEHEGQLERCIPFEIGPVSGASRFFYVAKASKSERNKNCGDLLTWENVDQNLQDIMEELNSQLKDTSDVTIQSLKDFEWSMILCGKDQTEKLQKDFKFTILMVIKLITELKTSNYSHHLNIKWNTLSVLRMIEESGLSLVESAELLNQYRQNTINEKMESVLGVSLAVLQVLLKIKGFAKQGNVHSTVKPIKLMQYLINLVTPPKGIVLDPFMGSGTTGVAAKNLGFGFIGIEKMPEYFEIAQKRIGA